MKASKGSRKKVFFSGPATKPYPPPSSLVATKTVFFLTHPPLSGHATKKIPIFYGFPKQNKKHDLNGKKWSWIHILRWAPNFY